MPVATRICDVARGAYEDEIQCEARVLEPGHPVTPVRPANRKVCSAIGGYAFPAARCATLGQPAWRDLLRRAILAGSGIVHRVGPLINGMATALLGRDRHTAALVGMSKVQVNVMFWRQPDRVLRKQSGAAENTITSLRLLFLAGSRRLTRRGDCDALQTLAIIWQLKKAGRFSNLAPLRLPTKLGRGSPAAGYSVKISTNHWRRVRAHQRLSSQSKGLPPACMRRLWRDDHAS